MTKGYAEIYLDDAMKNLGESFDYAVNACHLSADAYIELFIAGGIAEQFAHGNPKYISGQSGTELALAVFEKAGMLIDTPAAQVEYACSPEYWAGWVLAYYQWQTEKSFCAIHSLISMENILRMYPTLHEASEDKFVDTVNLIMERKQKLSKLQEQRKRCGYSQRELAEKAGVNLRTLQQYELKTKSLAKASVATVMALANVLGCRIEEILE